MAGFSVREVEGMRQVRIAIDDETVRTRRGALSNLHGHVRVTARLSGPRDIFRSLFTQEARVRPSFSGTGVLNLQPSLGGYHMLGVEDARRILEPGVYWAAENSVQIGLYRERIFPSLWVGDGLLVWKTTLEGQGDVAINAPGAGGRRHARQRGTACPGPARAGTHGRAAILLASGEQFLPVLPGRAEASAGLFRHRQGAGLLDPYWNHHMYRRMSDEDIEGSLFE